MKDKAQIIFEKIAKKDIISYLPFTKKRRQKNREAWVRETPKGKNFSRKVLVAYVAKHMRKGGRKVAIHPKNRLTVQQVRAAKRSGSHYSQGSYKHASKKQAAYSSLKKVKGIGLPELDKLVSKINITSKKYSKEGKKLIPLLNRKNKASVNRIRMRKNLEKRYQK
jgi:hypothetical protein